MDQEVAPKHPNLKSTLMAAIPPARPAPDDEPEPRWPALLALMAGACLHYVLPSRLSVGPDWLLTAFMAALVVPIIASRRLGKNNAARWLTFMATSLLTLALMTSLALLIQGLPSHKDQPAILLRSAGVLWITNIIVFALWYWKLDAGGPSGRDKAVGSVESSFLFPQMARQPPDESWSPEFIDYLFLAFNTSTAFSPTDTPVLDSWAKILTMLQSLISLSVLVVLAARAINVL